MLVTQFPIDVEKLEAALPTLWERWDITQSGSITKVGACKESPCVSSL